MTYLLDTHVLSELVKQRKNPGVLDWFAGTRRGDHHVSVMSVGELRRGLRRMELRNDVAQATKFAGWLDATLVEYAERIVPVTADVAQRWGILDARRPTPVANGLIGATAAAHGWTMVTRNTKDFQHIGVPLLNPFTEEDAR